MEKEKASLTIEEFNLFRWFRRILFSAWILFSIYMFEINPIFFSITSLLAFLQMLNDSNLKYIIYQDRIEVTTIFLISYFNKTNKIEYSNIENIDYHEPEIDWFGWFMALVVGIGRPIDRGNNFEFKFRDGKVNRYRAIGSHEKNKSIHRFIKERIGIKKQELIKMD